MGSAEVVGRQAEDVGCFSVGFACLKKSELLVRQSVCLTVQAANFLVCRSTEYIHTNMQVVPVGFCNLWDYDMDYRIFNVPT